MTSFAVNAATKWPATWLLSSNHWLTSPRALRTAGTNISKCIEIGFQVIRGCCTTPKPQDVSSCCICQISSSIAKQKICKRFWQISSALVRSYSSFLDLFTKFRRNVNINITDRPWNFQIDIRKTLHFIEQCVNYQSHSCQNLAGMLFPNFASSSRQNFQKFPKIFRQQFSEFRCV